MVKGCLEEVIELFLFFVVIGIVIGCGVWLLTAPAIGSSDYVDMGVADGYNGFNETVYIKCVAYQHNVDSEVGTGRLGGVTLIGSLAGCKCDKLYYYSKGYVKGYEKRFDDEEKYNLYESIISGRENVTSVYVPQILLGT